MIDDYLHGLLFQTAPARLKELAAFRSVHPRRSLAIQREFIE
jgi:hypothetical protein